MVDLILKAYQKFEGTIAQSLDDIYAIDAEVRDFVEKI